MMSHWSIQQICLKAKVTYIKKSTNISRISIPYEARLPSIEDLHGHLIPPSKCT